ncbi:phage head closure protein [uncultured Clostridium sp.]|jgi:SPP1 family predicted phage head-tail adaptor|uniref:phage head closure protein n=1 Tax=uncultured Clostridium sp. TaxID=59620 RepID=UPI002639E268|nr:phage head closure protein [uncultured Clostridium sp.]
MDTRIEIKKREKEIIDGRSKENLKPYYKCWCELLELFGKELYEAINIKYENTLVFKVRYCKKIKEMRKSNKSDFLVVCDGIEYDIYQIDFKQNKKDWVYLKAKMVI